MARHSASRLEALFTNARLPIVGGTSLFRTTQAPDASALAQRLAEAGMLVRTFNTAPTWLRCGLPPDEMSWARLAASLA